MSSRLLQFWGDEESDGKRVYYHRTRVDGVPFRSRGAPPALTQEEFEMQCDVVHRAGYGTFDTTTPDQRHFGRTLAQVLDGISIGWFWATIPEISKRLWVKDPVTGRWKVMVYIEWVERFKEYVGEH